MIAESEISDNKNAYFRIFVWPCNRFSLFHNTVFNEPICWIATVSWFITKPYLLSYQKKERAIDIEILIEPALKHHNLSHFDATQCTYYRHIYSCSLQPEIYI